ncbi:ATP-binding protein [Polyangium sp. 6x1]|uniref:sensor histidine kinase n=1 Tax=Polyangium sp. 6x1 TaxID=3042689 RepID=UPI0024828C63|nr:ATP-binding protein [Polyangium sp. 6x1]MDI1442741.1 ATP-binding protein [Polyangium sp. 6x1]
MAQLPGMSVTCKGSTRGPSSDGAESAAPPEAEVSCQEIVERLHRAEQALRESEERFRACTQTTFDAIAIHDDELVLFANDELARMFGYTLEEITCKHSLDWLVPASATLARQSVLDASEETYEAIGRRKDGTTFPVELRGKSIVYQGRRVRVTTLADITERERNLDTAERRAAELEAVTGIMLDPVLVVDAVDWVTLANRAALRLFGIEQASEAPRDPGAVLDSMQLRHLDGRPVKREEMPIVRALGGETVCGEWGMVRLPGMASSLYIQRSAAPIFDRNGDVRGAVWVARDVTGCMKLDQLKEEFVRIAAHELETPVAVMKGHAQLLLRRAPADLSSRSRSALEAINRGADRIDRIVQDLLDISQLQAGTLELVHEQVDLPALVREVARRFAADGRTHVIRLHIEGEATVSADRQRLESVIYSVLDNAFRFSAPGSEVDVEVIANGREACVCIQDRGVGIPRAMQARIFERFYRAHTDTPHDYGGMGVGLFIARAIIEAHGGAMWFGSEEGRGSRFCFRLPMGGVEGR